MVRKATPADRQQLEAAADRLHSAAIRLLRRAREQDPRTGLSPARLSALSVLVFGGPRSLGDLARAEQVRPPTITRLVSGLEAEGYVKRRPDPADRRVTRVHATAKGRRALEAGRRRRIEILARELARLDRADLARCERAAGILLELLSS